MREIKRHPTTPQFVPDYMARSIADIDFEALAAAGVRYVAFDADSTLVPSRGVSLSPQTKKLLVSKKKLFKKWCIASNRITHDLYDLGKAIDAGVVQAGLRGRKPKRKFFARVLDHLNAQPDEVVMIGDKLLADIWGANRAGFMTVWVEHLGRDIIWDRAIGLRSIERRLLKKYL